MSRLDALIAKAEAESLTQADVDHACLLMELDSAKHREQLLAELIDDERAADQQLQQLLDAIVSGAD